MNSKNNISWLIIIPSERSASFYHPILGFETAHNQGVAGELGASSAIEYQLIYDKNPRDKQYLDQVILAGLEGRLSEAVLDHESANPLR
jgi:hypothetical protein